eukprot:403372843
MISRPQYDDQRGFGYGMTNQPQNMQTMQTQSRIPQKDITMYQTTYFDLKKLLTQKRAPVSLKEASNASVFGKVDAYQFIDYITNNPKEISYNEDRREFVFKSKYGIKSKEDLLKLLLNNPEGIKEDDDLRVCYKGLEEDLQELKNNGWIRVIKFQRDKQIVLFPVNKNDGKVEVREKIGTKISTMLSEIWDKDIEQIEEFKFEQVLLDNNLSSQFEKEQLIHRQRQKQSMLEREQDLAGQLGQRRQRRAKKQMNDHIDLDLLDVL